MENYKYGILTISDSCFNHTASDSSGPAIKTLIISQLKSNKISYQIIPDEIDKIENSLKFFCDVLAIDVIFTTGGTGFGPRDVTPEATKRVIQKEAPHFSNLMFMESLKKTKFAVLSRAVCGIRNNTLIINFPGSKKAVMECFDAIYEVLPHAIQLIKNEMKLVKNIHRDVQSDNSGHICPHKVGAGGDSDRNSTYPMISVKSALEIIFSCTKPLANYSINEYRSSINIPPFRASIKDGYAVKVGGAAIKKVIGTVSAGDGIIISEFDINECYKINTGAPVPDSAEAIVQIEDTKLLSKHDTELENEIEILLQPKLGLDIRQIGSDMHKDELLFENLGNPLGIAEKSLLASVGISRTDTVELSIAIISTGNELIEPNQNLKPGQIYDSNTTMLKLLVEQFGFKVKITEIVKDNMNDLITAINRLEQEKCQVIIGSGGVSMGDKDFIKPALLHLSYDIKFGRVNMKPGKPMTFGYKKKNNTYFFGLPGNPVSAFVTFHLFVLPCLKKLNGWSEEKCQLPRISVKLENDKINLDSRPEYCRASITSKNGELWAEVTGNQISSRLKSIVGADVLLQLPQKSEDMDSVTKGTILSGTVLKHDFISKYE